jgi:flagellar protein FlaF
MTATQSANAAYARPDMATKTPRDTEYELLRRVTNRLNATQKADANHPELVSALHENRTIWTKLATLVADPDNKLPDELRARLFYLAEFTLHQSRKVLAGDSDIKALVEVNSAVMSGLITRRDAA